MLPKRFTVYFIAKEKAKQVLTDLGHCPQFHGHCHVPSDTSPYSINNCWLPSAVTLFSGASLLSHGFDSNPFASVSRVCNRFVFQSIFQRFRVRFCALFLGNSTAHPKKAKQLTTEKIFQFDIFF